MFRLFLRSLWFEMIVAPCSSKICGIAQWIGTATGRFLSYSHEVTLTVLGIETTATVYFAADEDFPVNALGRVGWLDRVRLGLVDYDSRLYLSDYNDPA
jgi:hypothetical protein